MLQEHKPKVNIEQFREDVDSWIKQIRAELSILKDLPEMVEMNAELNQENYESIEELKEQVKEIKQELHLIKLMQLKFMLEEN